MGVTRTAPNRSRAGVTASVVTLVAVLVCVPSRSAPLRDGSNLPPRGPARLSPAPAAPAADDRVRAIVALIDLTRARADAPGLGDEERDALAELAWAQADEALEDPLLHERAQRDPDFLQVQALLLLDAGEGEDALAVLERLTVIAPNDPETHRLLALTLMDLGRTAGAIAAYRRALSLQLGGAAAADVRAHLGYALAVAGFLDEGLAESERAIVLDPSAYFGHFIRGWILGKAGRRDEERRAYLEAVLREQNDADLWELLALSWERAGEAARAREAWREVARIDPSDEEAAGKAAPAQTLTQERLSD